MKDVKEPNTGHTTRRRPMRVLALGMGRTGTTSTAAALRQLGYHTYDWDDRLRLGHVPAWTDAMLAKWYGKGPKPGREEFDRLTGDFDAVLDNPCCFFVDELAAAYPDAKVILTTRDPDRWQDSMNRTIFAVSGWPSWKILQHTDPWYDGIDLKFQRTFWGAICKGDRREECRQTFLDHNDYVRKVTEPSNLLEFQVQEGWGPLCEFLGVPEPDAPFPRVYDSKEIVARYDELWRASVKRSISFASVVLLGVTVVVYGARVGVKMMSGKEFI